MIIMPISAVTSATAILSDHPTTKGGRGERGAPDQKGRRMLYVQRPAVMVGVHIRNAPGSSPIGSTSAGGGETQCLCRRILVSQGRINIASITIIIVYYCVHPSVTLFCKLCKAPSPAEDIPTPPDKTRPSIPLPPPHSFIHSFIHSSIIRMQAPPVSYAMAKLLV
ncbi:hypothetical protein ASPBRDRAFT_277287 [Aspergillus brasiliensis CBS 101740]|uniref:Uncharacterized protein n=1 Tax=Aspergillus brasiliensis (strain CBS 101740 / IMI 381727 / IBT 21946) TaxID=767769 RepID=A0A1L9UCN4_ASPBC|nr:hypothetical protein ASPBRDRAFT_277287 [Aspergillus brasiliensis CBS 101740]